jgi:hypothetical protein
VSAAEDRDHVRAWIADDMRRFWKRHERSAAAEAFRRQGDPRAHRDVKAPERPQLDLFAREAA